MDKDMDRGMTVTHSVGTLISLAIGAVFMGFLVSRLRRKSDETFSYRWVKRRSQLNRVIHYRNHGTYI